MSDFYRDTIKNSQKSEACFAQKHLKIGLILLGFGISTPNERYNISKLQKRSLLPSCPYRTVTVICEPRRGSCLVSPGADVEPFAGS